PRPDRHRDRHRDGWAPMTPLILVLAVAFSDTLPASPSPSSAAPATQVSRPATPAPPPAASAPVAKDASGKASALRLIQSIPMAGVPGRLDHMALDQARGRLLIPAFEANTLQVIDLALGKRTRMIPGFRGPQGVTYVPFSDRIFVT